MYTVLGGQLDAQSLPHPGWVSRTAAAIPIAAAAVKVAPRYQRRLRVLIAALAIRPPGRAQVTSGTRVLARLEAGPRQVGRLVVEAHRALDRNPGVRRWGDVSVDADDVRAR